MAKLYSSELDEIDKALEVLSSCLSLIKWRLKPSSKRRLQIDLMALCTGMRPVIMVDYGGKMPELQERLCALLELIQKESIIFEHLRVMVIEDMIYLIHVEGLAELVDSTLSLQAKLLFVDLEQDPPQIVTLAEQHSVVLQLVSILKLFSLSFPVDGTNNDLKPSEPVQIESSNGEQVTYQSSKLIDLSCCMQDTQVTVPTLNGWLLGYPIVYLFGKEHITDAIHNLSTKSLHLFKILIRRRSTSPKESWQEELTSFSVPYELSMRGSSEPWAKEFHAQMQEKWERCKSAWISLEMDVSECNPLAIVL